MALNANKTSILRAIARCGFATNANPRPVGKPADVQTHVLSNKIVVAAADSVLPITRVSVVFRAGSRNESYDTQGASHMMRIAAGLTTKVSSAFAITRNIQQAGGNLTATSDREIMSYTVETTANKVEVGLHYLQDVVNPAFKPWELEDVVPRIKHQVASVPPAVQAVELLHRAAYRHGLGNSVYIPKFQIGKLSSETLLHYVANNCTSSRCAVVGVGIDLNTLSGFAQQIDLGTSSGKSDSADYFGGDARKDTPGQLAHVAVAGQGGSLANQKEALAFAVLQHAVGAAPPTKRGKINGSFGKALDGVVSGASASFAALNASYADAGLFGFVVSADAQQIGKAVDALTKALKSGSVSTEDVNRGKALLKASVLEAYAKDSSLVHEIGVQASISKRVLSSDEMLSAIDSITQQDVQQAARKSGSSKLSVGAVGNLANVPYASDLV